MEGPFIVPVAFFISAAFITVFLPMAKAYAKRMERGAVQPRVPADVTQRLERMEQAIDAIAVEVERISEGQRFVTRLLSERPAGAQLPAARESAGGAARV